MPRVTPLIFSLLLVAAASSGACPAFGADFKHVLTDYSIAGWSQKDGLAPGSVTALAEDATGYIWVGTNAGLYRFDGVSVMPWKNFGSDSLPNERVQALAVDANGNLWVAFGGSSPVLAWIRDGRATIASIDQGFDGSLVTFLQSNSPRTLWMGTQRGLYSLEHKKWHKTTGPNLPTNAAFFSLLEDDELGLIVGTSAGIFRRPTTSTGFTALEHFSQPAKRLWEDVPHALAKDANGRIYVTDYIRGYRPVDSSFSGGSFPMRGRGARFLRDADGNLWLGTSGQGLWRLKAGRASESAVPEYLNNLTGLLGDGVGALLADHDGNIWVGTTEGLNRLTPKKVEQLTQLGLVVAVDALQDGSILVETVDTLLKFTKGNSALGATPLKVPGGVFSALHVDEHDTTWVANNRGVVRLMPGKDPATSAKGTEHLRHVVAMSSDGSGGAWLYDKGQGLVRWNSGVIHPGPVAQRSDDRQIVYLFTDRTGDLWVAWDRGGISVIRKKGEIQSYGPADGLKSGTVYFIFQDAHGFVWTAGEFGIARYENGRFKIATMNPNSRPAIATSIASDDAGFYWSGTDSGIIRFNPDDVRRASPDGVFKIGLRLFARADGLAGFPYPYYTTRRIARAADGRLWFVTGRGITIVNPAKLAKPERSGTVLIDSVLVNDRPQLPSSGVAFPATTSRVTINYTALHVTSPLRTRFRYRLDGFDDDWIDAGKRRQVSYTNLPPRSYSFRVLATSDDDAWPEVEGSWTFSVAPHFYQTAWFFSATLCSIGLLIWGGWRMHVVRVRRQFTLVLSERVRLSRELHDTLLQGMVGVALQLEAVSDPGTGTPAITAEWLRHMRRYLEDYIREARQSISELRSAQLQTVDLASALHDNAVSSVSGTNIEVDFDTVGDHAQLRPPVEAAILRIGNEAISNAVRHSGSDILRVQLAYSSLSFQLTVHDRGRGFEVAQVSKYATHFGLLTMKERAAEIEADLRLDSRPGSGTTVTLTVPLA